MAGAKPVIANRTVTITTSSMVTPFLAIVSSLNHVCHMPTIACVRMRRVVMRNAPQAALDDLETPATLESELPNGDGHQSFLWFSDQHLIDVGPKL